LPIFEPEGGFVASQSCGESGLRPNELIGADSLLTSTFAPAARQCAVGMYLTGANVDLDAQTSFLASYNELFGKSPESGFAPHSYDAMKMLLAAIEAVSVSDPDGTLHIPRQALRDALYATVGFQGLTGLLGCNSNGDCASPVSVAIYQITQENVDGTADLINNEVYWVPSQ
jgi:branched-chain amino acid transport system substrate-binding protein